MENLEAFRKVIKNTLFLNYIVSVNILLVLGSFVGVKGLHMSFDMGIGSVW